jgi:methionyl aminopeptidase
VEYIAEAGRVAAGCLAEMPIVAGMTTAGLDKWAEAYIRDHTGCTPAFKGYTNFPSTLCTSVNHEVVHGLPTESQVLEEGDIVAVDVGVCYKGFNADHCRTFPVGEVCDDVRKLLTRCEQARDAGILLAVPGINTTDITFAIQMAVGPNFGIPPELAGHGIGRHLHEDPAIYNCFHEDDEGIVLEAGHVICIEPVITLGGSDIALSPDGWTVETVDKSWCAHFEHTVLVTTGAPQVLTETEDRE